MANNRMFLVFRPTGRALCLGKRMAWGWYMGPTEEESEQFFYDCEDEQEPENQDDFVLVFEAPEIEGQLGFKGYRAGTPLHIDL